MIRCKRILIPALVMVLLFSCTGCKQKTDLDFTFYGAWFIDGELGDETYTFSAEGSIPVNIQPEWPNVVEEEIEFSIIEPKDFPYHFEDVVESGSFIYCSSLPCQTHYNVLIQCFRRDIPITISNPESSFPRLTDVRFCPQEGYIIIGFLQEPGKYLVGATDANVPMDRVIEHFAYAINPTL